ncbi:MAG: RHS repeat-associated core domain-containing protein, partial [Phycisphaerae bacterium]|nr:RHS repeat-associated core domain-containing protein [Phycisphaerae bacterium]
YAWDQRYIDAPVARFDAAGDAVYYTNDANMNVTSLVEESGTVVERYAYSPYGERTVLDGDWSTDADGLSDVNNTLGHQGLYLDTESALYYNRNRYYSPSLGRFTARDPLGYVDGMSTYEYVGSRPVSRLDPIGLEDVSLEAKLYYGHGITQRSKKPQHVRLGAEYKDVHGAYKAKWGFFICCSGRRKTETFRGGCNG